MIPEQVIEGYVANTLYKLYPEQNFNSQIQIQKTRKEFIGDFTLVIFPFIKPIGKKPETIGQEIGEELKNNHNEIEDFNFVKGFLNIKLSDTFWIKSLSFTLKDTFGYASDKSNKTYLVEYSSPNTNKPLHLGHLRNIFLGYSVSEILKANGHKVIKTQIINDRGIHICKSMLAWELSGKNESPETTGLKGDKLVGKYYVEFDKSLKTELKPILEEIYSGKINNQFSETEKTKLEEHLFKIKQLEEVKLNKWKTFSSADLSIFDTDTQELYAEIIKENSSVKDLYKKLDKLENPIAPQKEFIKQVREINQLEGKIDDEKGEIKEIAQNKTSLMKQAQEMLLAWEKGDEKIISLWKKMNAWVYDGFNKTYSSIGVDFDKLYYESDTYILGKDIVQEGLKKEVFFKKEDGSVWCDLTDEGLDLKLVLRSDGTSVYMTQDIGTAILRYKEFPQTNGMIYTVGNEQDYHFKVLFLILKKLGYPFANECFHLSYGMVDLPSGKMKSREGTVVDADDLVKEVINDLEKATIELGKLEHIAVEDRIPLYNTLGLAALKYYILKVDPKKRMLFNPADSIDIQGNTGPFILYTYARIQSLIRKANGYEKTGFDSISLAEQEKNLIILFNEFPTVVAEAGKLYSPALIANYIYDLTKTFNKFYDALPIIKEEDVAKRNLRLSLSENTANIIKNGMRLLGVGVVDRM